MSRLAAKEKLLYYPTPPCIVDALAHYLTTHRYGVIRWLDPCAGRGEALSRLASYSKGKSRWITIQTYGIEPELSRVKAASACLDSVLHTSFFSTTLSNGDGPDGGWQLCLLNPPYDSDTETVTNGRKSRLEVTFLQRTTLKLCEDGILIWIVPQRCLRYAARFLAAHYRELACVRFPDDLYQPDPAKPEQISLYEQFQQIVLFGVRRDSPIKPKDETIAQIRSWAQAGRSLPSLFLSDRVSSIPQYTLPVARTPELRLFSGGCYDPDKIASAVLEHNSSSHQYKSGVWNREYLTSRLPQTLRAEGIEPPLAPLKKAHLAVLATAGIANQAILTSGEDQQQLIVKGRVRKVPVKQIFEDEKEIVERITDRFESSLWGIDLHSGKLTRVLMGQSAEVPAGVDYDPMTLPDFLEQFGASLAEQVNLAHPPRYQGASALPWLEQSIGLLKRSPLGKQREAIASHVNAFLNPSDLSPIPALARQAEIAEMSTGKTFLALSTAFCADLFACGATKQAPAGLRRAHLFPLIILCPPIMAYKWQREAEQTIPDVKAVVIRRMGKRAREEPREEDEEETTVSADEALAQFRRFDPSFTGTSLSALGALDRAVKRIRTDLAQWKAAFHHAQRQGLEPPNKPCHIVIVTGSTAKLGMEWMPLYRLKIPRLYDAKSKKLKALRNEEGQIEALPACPSCFRLIKHQREVERLKKSDEHWQRFFEKIEELRAKGHLEVWREEASLPPTIYLTEKELQGTKDRRVKRRCADCGEPLWQEVPTRPKNWQPASPLRVDAGSIAPLPLADLSSSPPLVTSTFGRRYPLAKYIQQRYQQVFGLLVADEIHEGRDGSALCFARQRIANATGGGRMLGLTGTLSNGYAGSLFRFAYQLNPQVRRDFGYDEEERWIDLYGKREIVKKTFKGEVGTGSSSDRRVGAPHVRELAGFAPAGLCYLLSGASFLELADVAPALPPYEEETRLVEMDRDVERAYVEFRRDATTELGRMLAAGDKSGLAAWWNAMLTYPNMPYRGWTCMVKKTGDILATAPAFEESRLFAKEQAILSYVEQEISAGRKCLLFTENTGHYDVMPRLKRMLEKRVKGAYGKPLKVVTMYSHTVQPIDREAWLNRQIQEGCDVLICNPKLVKVGLDLIGFPTVLYASFPTSVSDLRQSSRRPYRIGQRQPVKVVFFVYPTMEADLLRLLALKMKSSLMVEGKLPGEGLVSFGEGEDDNETEMVLHLAREILSSLQKGETQVQVMERAETLQDLFRENARIEREKNQTLDENEPVEVSFKPIVVETLPRAEPLVDEEEARKISSSQGEVVEQEEEHQEAKNIATGSTPAKSRGKGKKTKAVDTQQAEQITVTIIQTGITSGKDPWAVLREKYLRPPKRRKKPAQTETGPDLWSFATQSAPEPKPETAKGKKHLASSSEQPSLWG